MIYPPFSLLPPETYSGAPTPPPASPPLSAPSAFLCLSCALFCAASRAFSRSFATSSAAFWASVWTPCRLPCATNRPNPSLQALSSRKTRRSLPWLHGEQTPLLLLLYGLRVHLVASGGGEPVEYSLAAASEADISLSKQLSLHLPEGSIIHAEKGCTGYHYEDLLKEVGLHLKAQRKKRSKRPMAAWEEFLSKPARQYIETVISIT